MSALIESVERRDEVMADLIRRGLADPADFDNLIDFRTFRHGPQRKVITVPGDRELIVTKSRERYSLDVAHTSWFGIRLWTKVVVSVAGALEARLADQKRIGRQRRGHERSPAPLPDWYELTHLVYEHGQELGLDPVRPVYQYLPGADEPYLNVAEALHLRQPS